MKTVGDQRQIVHSDNEFTWDDLYSHLKSLEEAGLSIGRDRRQAIISKTMCIIGDMGFRIRRLGGCYEESILTFSEKKRYGRREIIVKYNLKDDCFESDHWNSITVTFEPEPCQDGMDVPVYLRLPENEDQEKYLISCVKWLHSKKGIEIYEKWSTDECRYEYPILTRRKKWKQRKN